MKIFLRDTNQDVVNAWQYYFNGIEDIDVSCGDIFDIKADGIVSPANSFGFMNGGIDLAYSLKFGWQLEKHLQAHIQDKYDGELIVGNAAVIPTMNIHWPYLISCPTMRIPMNVSNTPNAFLAFRAALRVAKRYGGINSIVCPGLCTLTGNMPAEKSAKQMFDAYKQSLGFDLPVIETLDDAVKYHYWQVTGKIDR